MNRRLYSRLVYSMAYVCAVAIFAFSVAGIPNDLLIAFAVACLVAGGFINSGREDEQQIQPQKDEEERLTTINDEMREARMMAQAESQA
jgi:hypothetical protein